MYRIIPLRTLRRTSGVKFDEFAKSDIPRINGIDRIIHGPFSISPGPVSDAVVPCERPWYMHRHQDDNLLANETASRVHNSGHITINNYTSSQFDQHIRAVCNLTVEEPKLINKGKMINILGEEILKFRKKKFSNNEHFFDYGKKIIRPKRKMGHLNIIEL